MAVAFSAQRANLTFQATFGEHMFSLWRSPELLFKNLFSRLAQYGLQLDDLKWGNSTAVGDVHLVFFLLNFAVVTRIRIDRFEFEAFDLLRVDLDQVAQAASQVLDALVEHDSTLRVVTYSLSAAYHEKLEGQTARDFTAPLAMQPPKVLGPPIGTGVIFSSGSEDARLASSVTLEPSSVVPEGLFVRINTIWDATRVGINDVRVRAPEYGERVLAEFGLALPRQ
jgi:hypothetical protein